MEALGIQGDMERQDVVQQESEAGQPANIYTYEDERTRCKYGQTASMEPKVPKSRQKRRSGCFYWSQGNTPILSYAEQQADSSTCEEGKASEQTWAGGSMNPRGPEPRHGEKRQGQPKQRAEL